MPRSTSVTAGLMLFSMFSSAMAQRLGPPGDQDRDRGGGQIPAPGTLLPTVTAFDDQGKTFSTASLRGSYTVLVFGCLT